MHLSVDIATPLGGTFNVLPRHGVQGPLIGRAPDGGFVFGPWRLLELVDSEGKVVAVFEPADGVLEDETRGYRVYGGARRIR